MRRLLTLVAIAAASLGLSACTLVPVTPGPEAISPRTVPFGLLGKSIPGTDNGRVTFITQPVYIVDATGHLAPSSRIVPAPPTLLSVLRELILGPTAIETGTGYTSAIPENVVIEQASVIHGIGVIDVPRPLASIPRPQLVMAIGQLVYTAAAVGATRGIEIEAAGTPERLPTPRGGLTTIANEAEYRPLLNG